MMTELQIWSLVGQWIFLVPENVTEATKGLGGFSDPGLHFQIGASVVVNDTSQVLEIGDRLNRGFIGVMDGRTLYRGTTGKDRYAFGLRTADRHPKSTAVGG